MRKSKRLVGKVCEITMEELTFQSLEELIDRGVRFTIVDKEEKEEEVDDEDGN